MPKFDLYTPLALKKKKAAMHLFKMQTHSHNKQDRSTQKKEMYINLNRISDYIGAATIQNLKIGKGQDKGSKG